MMHKLLLISLCLFSSVSWGNCDGDCVNGYGAYSSPNGYKYVGQWKGGAINGQGTLTFVNGSTHVGQFKNNKLHGSGTRNWADGSTYVGQWTEGVINGQGILTYVNGSTYVGQFKDDKLHGSGTRNWADGSTYVGQYREGYLSGQGTLIWADGSKYVGQWKDDKRHGQGAYTPSGKTVAGFLNGIGAELSTEGEYTVVARIIPRGPADRQGLLQTSDRIIGVGQGDNEIVDIIGFRLADVVDLIIGKKGSTVRLKVMPSNKLISIVRGKVDIGPPPNYVGQWRDNKRHGQGASTYTGGRKFVGLYSDNEIVPGQGTEYLPDGRQLIFKQNSVIELYGANGQILRAIVYESELYAIRGESAERKRLADEEIAEQRRQQRKLITGIQQQLINHKYLSGTADGIAGKNTLNALKVFYRDAELSPPNLNNYSAIVYDLDTKLLSAKSNCARTPANARGFSVCFTVN